MAHARSPIIVAFADGRVVEVGSHDQLMAAKGFGHDRCLSRSQRRSAHRRSSRSSPKLTGGCPVREQPAGLVWPPSVASGEGFGLQPLEL